MNTVFYKRHLHTEVTGKQLNDTGEKFYKFLDEYMNDDNFKYTLGEQTVDNFVPSYMFPCSEKAMHFTTFDTIFRRNYNNIKLCEIQISDDSKCYIEHNRIKADKITIVKITHICSLDWWNDIDICLKAVKQNGNILFYVKEQTEEICLEAVKQNGDALKHVKEQTEEICLEAVKNCDALKHVKKQTEEICLEAIKRHPFSLYDVKKQTNKICLEAVKRCGYMLNGVNEQTDEICLEAVKRDKHALEFVKKQTHKICLEAVKYDGYSLEFVEHKFRTDEICMEAIIMT